MVLALQAALVHMTVGPVARATASSPRFIECTVVYRSRWASTRQPIIPGPLAEENSRVCIADGCWRVPGKTSCITWAIPNQTSGTAPA